MERGRPKALRKPRSGINNGCRNVVKLRWGGRQYKDKNKRIKLPPNTKLFEGVLVIKDKSVISKSKSQKVRKFVMLSGEESEPTTSLKCAEREDILGGSENRNIFQNDAVLELLDKPIASFDEETTNEPLTQILDQPTKEQRGHCMEECVKGSGEGPAETSVKTVTKDSSENDIEEIVESRPESALFMTPHYPRGKFLYKQPSWQVDSVFNFFISETSSLLAISEKGQNLNPFRTVLPQMAMCCPPLMKLVVAFGARHRNRLSLAQDEEQFPSLDEEQLSEVDYNSMAQDLLQQCVADLMIKMSSLHKVSQDGMLAVVLLLATFGIFFSDVQCKWRTHFLEAKRIVVGELNAKALRDSNSRHGSKKLRPHSFLERWLKYINIVGLLSSATFQPDTESVLNRSMIDNELQMHESGSNYDIDYLRGMDKVVFFSLGHIASLIAKKESLQRGCQDHTIFTDAVGLDYKLMNHLQEGERLRSLEVESGRFTAQKPEHYDYQLVRATNLLFGLTGILQLRRRVIEMPQDSELLTDLIIRITS